MQSSYHNKTQESFAISCGEKSLYTRSGFCVLLTVLHGNVKSSTSLSSECCAYSFPERRSEQGEEQFR